MNTALLARRTFRRLEILDHMFGTQVAFVLGALAAAVPLLGALLAANERADAAERSHSQVVTTWRQITTNEAADRFQLTSRQDDY